MKSVLVCQNCPDLRLQWCIVMPRFVLSGNCHQKVHPTELLWLLPKQNQTSCCTILVRSSTRKLSIHQPCPRLCLSTSTWQPWSWAAANLGQNFQQLPTLTYSKVENELLGCSLGLHCRMNEMTFLRDDMTNTNHFYSDTWSPFETYPRARPSLASTPWHWDQPRTLTPMTRSALSAWEICITLQCVENVSGETLVWPCLDWDYF